MKCGLFYSRLFVFTVAIATLIVVAQPAIAKTMYVNRYAFGTQLTINKIGEVPMGETFIITGNLKDSKGKPVPDKNIKIIIDGNYFGQTKTDDQGNFSREFKNKLDAGLYTITASTSKTRFLDAAISSSTITVLPAAITIQMIPPIEGVHFLWDGKRYISDASGLAVIHEGVFGAHQLQILAEDYKNPSQRLEFGRWLFENYSPTTTIQVPSEEPIQVGLNVYHLVSQRFVDDEGKSVDPGWIQSYAIRSIQGDFFEFTDSAPHWIPASRVGRRLVGLDVTRLLYSVIRVNVDGSNVVNQSQQKFFTNPADVWNISLLFYTLSFTARDALFGTPVGNSINLTFPDGSVKSFPLGKEGTIVFPSLARGLYLVEVVGAKGLSSRSPVALSRSQDVHVKVLTYLDLTVVGILGIMAALGLLLYGRPGIVTGSVQKSRLVLDKNRWVALFAGRAKGPVFRAGNQSPRSDETDNSLNAIACDLAGIDRVIINRMLEFIQMELGDPKMNSKLTRENQILLTLDALRGELTGAQLGQKYGVSTHSVKRIVKKIKETISNSNELYPYLEAIMVHPSSGSENGEDRKVVKKDKIHKVLVEKRPMKASYDSHP